MIRACDRAHTRACNHAHRSITICVLAFDAFEPSEVFDHALVVFQTLKRFPFIFKHLLIRRGESFESKLVSLGSASKLQVQRGTHRKLGAIGQKPRGVITQSGALFVRALTLNLDLLDSLRKPSPTNSSGTSISHK